MYDRSEDLAPFQQVGVVTRTDKLAKTGVSLEALHFVTSEMEPRRALANVLLLEESGDFFHLS
jgi:hypothetical protein